MPRWVSVTGLCRFPGMFLRRISGMLSQQNDLASCTQLRSNLVVRLLDLCVALLRFALLFKQVAHRKRCHVRRVDHGSLGGTQETA